MFGLLRLCVIVSLGFVYMKYINITVHLWILNVYFDIVFA